MIWESKVIPDQWKESLIVPIGYIRREINLNVTTIEASFNLI